MTGDSVALQVRIFHARPQCSYHWPRSLTSQHPMTVETTVLMNLPPLRPLYINGDMTLLSPAGHTSRTLAVEPTVLQHVAGLPTVFGRIIEVGAAVLTYRLNDGYDIPAIALGTTLGHLADGTRVLPVNHSTARAVQWALEAGYRHIDTASLYRVEDEVGLGIRWFERDSKGHRHDVFVTTKLWNDAHGKDEVIPALKESLNQLQTDYVDLYLMHYPMAYYKNGSISLTDYLETWKSMEIAKEENLTRSIGVSNFNLTQMQRLWDGARIKPAVLQIEVNPTITQDELIAWCTQHGVVVMAYTPFGGIFGRKKDAPPPRADHPVLQRLAKKYNKTVPQILLRYLLDRKLVAIPGSTNKERIMENISIMDFSLTPEEITELSGFNRNYRLRTPAKWYPHPHFPFEKKNLTDEEIRYIIEHSKED